MNKKLKKMLEKGNGYDWKYVTVGGMTRIDIQNGEDIAHLGELDRKLWTVLSCPTTGLEFDAKTLAMLDTNGDGKIHVDEVIAASQWLTGALKDPDTIISGSDSIALSNFNEENEEGAKLLKSAKQILSNLGLEKDSISLADTSDSIAIFAKTQFNGDGIITPASTSDEKLQAVINAAITAVGSVQDRSGEAGLNSEKIEAFYTACADYKTWKDAGKADEAAILPYGDKTADALSACNAVKDKVADYFMRCKLISFNSECSGAVDVPVAKIESISDKNLSACAEEIAEYPLARPSATGLLPVAEGINPAWKAAFATLKTAVMDIDFPGAESISEEQWNGILAKFGAYEAWMGAKKGAEVEALGIEAVEGFLAEDRKAELLELVAKDAALADEANSIDSVDKLLHFHRYFYQFLKNYVSFKDFFTPDKNILAVFQSGKLFIDQRCCDLCIRVSDMGKHADMAGLSGMFLIYCNCVSKVTGKTVDIVAVLTDGEVSNLRAGMNALYYDREGIDYDAVITKIVDNPISIRQAFWSPYRKFAAWISEKVNKMASEKESKGFADMTAKAETASVPGDPNAKKQPFDIAKFAGIFAAIGMALGYLGKFLVDLAHGVSSAHWWEIILVIAAIILVISGPSMFIAWRKLRKRNLAPVLNANGWAINAAALVNIKFGATLTSMAKYPKIKMDDPFAKKMAGWKKALIWCAVIIVILGGLFAWLYFTNRLADYGLPHEKATTEVVEEAPAAEETAEVAAEAPAAEEPAAE